MARAASVLWVLTVMGVLACGAPAGMAAPDPGLPAPSVFDAEWTAPAKPFQIYGNTYYVGTGGLSSILITSSAGHVLIDGTVQEAAAMVAGNVRALGFKVEDIRLILNSHVHFDHAGAIAALQKISGAQVAASASSAQVLMQGHSGPDDPQYASLARGPDPVLQVRVISDGETLAVGALRVAAHFTPGHTPGGTSWTWQSCEKGRCLHMVYADSLSVVSAPDFKFSPTAATRRCLRTSRRALRSWARCPATFC